MEIMPLLAAVAAFGLPCSNPELRDFPVQEMPWPAAYIRSIEGHDIIALRAGVREDEEHLSRILVHVLDPLRFLSGVSRTCATVSSTP